MTQRTSGDTSPPEGYRPDSERTTDERLDTHEGWLLDLDKRMALGDLARNSQFASVVKLVAAEAEASRAGRAESGERDAHLAEGLMANGSAINDLRVEVRGLAKAVGRLSEEVSDGNVALIKELGAMQRTIAGLHQKDSWTEITLTEHKDELDKATGEIKKTQSALAKVGAQFNLVNYFRVGVLAMVGFVSSHPAQVIAFFDKVLGRLFG